MTLSDLSIRRPVFAWMLMAALIIFGAISFNRMGVSELPDVDLPTINITANYDGAAPEVMEADVVDPIEDALTSIQGVRNINSIARNAVADITVEFNLGRDIDLAFQDVQAQIARIQSQLPDEMDPVTMQKVNPEDFPIMWLSVANSEMPLQDLMIFVRDEIRDRLTTVPGVGSLWTPGFLEPNLRVWVDNDALKRYVLTVSDVINTIRLEHLEPPSGRTEYNLREFSLRTLGEARSPQEFAQIPIITRGGQPNYRPTLMGKVASIEEGTEDVVQFARSNGNTAVGIGVVKQRGANAVEVARAIRARVAEIRKSLPPHTQMIVNFDGTKFVEESVQELVLTLVLAALLTSIVCWFFLGSVASTINVLLAIPTSVLGTFIVLYFSGFTLNIFTLLGLSLAIGIIVDDAIMVLENIIRHREMGKPEREAAIDGAREITFAALAATIAIVAIFLPIIFVQGIVGRFLFQFGITMSAAVMLSLLEALTLTPMRASQFIGSGHRRTRIGRFFESGFASLRKAYERTLNFSLRHKWMVITGSLVFFVFSFGSVTLLKGEFQPPQDQGQLIIQLTNPAGSSITYTSQQTAKVENFLKNRPEVASYFAAGGGFTGGEPNSAFIFVNMKEKGERGVDPKAGRELSQQDLIQVTRETLQKLIPTAEPKVQDPSTQGFSSGRGFPIEFTIQGPDWNRLAALSEQIIARLKKEKIMADVDSDYQTGAPEVQITPNRRLAAASAVSVQPMAETVNAMIGGVVAGKYLKNGRRYDVRVKLEEAKENPAALIKELDVRNNRGEIVPIQSVIQVEQKPVAPTISRKNRERSIAIFGNIAPGRSQQETLQDVERIATEILPEQQGYKFELSGATQEFQETFTSLIFALGLGLVVSYMVLGSQFNSFIDPFTVLMALPFSFSGAFLALLIGGQTLNMYSMIGLILLMGIVKKNSILLVDFTNQRRDREKMPVQDALLVACPTRLRPILMTSFATIAAAIPAAISLGPGAEARQPMAVAVIGGVLVSTLLTLYVVPSVYLVLARFDRREREQRRIKQRGRVKSKKSDLVPTT